MNDDINDALVSWASLVRDRSINSVPATEMVMSRAGSIARNTTYDSIGIRNMSLIRDLEPNLFIMDELQFLETDSKPIPKNYSSIDIFLKDNGLSLDKFKFFLESIPDDLAKPEMFKFHTPGVLLQLLEKRNLTTGCYRVTFGDQIINFKFNLEDLFDSFFRWDINENFKTYLEWEKLDDNWQDFIEEYNITGIPLYEVDYSSINPRILEANLNDI